jgi:hypothetical protein
MTDHVQIDNGFSKRPGAEGRVKLSLHNASVKTQETVGNRLAFVRYSIPREPLLCLRNLARQQAGI